MTASIVRLSICALLLGACVGDLRGDLPSADDASTPTPPRDAGVPIDAPALDAGELEEDDASIPTIDAGPPPPTVMDPGTEGDGDFTIGPSYADAPEMRVPDDAPRGRVYRFSMQSEDSEIYPGVTGRYTRDLWIYVPRQYVNGTEAPFMVIQDGGGYVGDVTAALDTLIHQHRLPHVIGIFINPGPGDGPGSERGLEYDRVSDHYTRFIETEVLPLIPMRPDIRADYPDLRLTSDPEGRATMGGSSGGACAFTMAWFHPELYRRVLTYSGTFVAQHRDDEHPRGAWEYHEHMIRDEAVKPIRVFLQVGENDLNFGSDGLHNWMDANRRMSDVLEDRGYHYRFLWSEDAGHVDRRVLRQTLPETLLWLWRGYPIPDAPAD
ncbi:Ferric enterobactin esterase [Sandaracinus amylolyticus]|nr:Ferric enterobactin esterase [Sandaracinus amylolyticus]